MADPDQLEERIVARAHVSKSATNRLLRQVGQMLAKSLNEDESLSVDDDGRFHLRKRRRIKSASQTARPISLPKQPPSSSPAHKKEVPHPLLRTVAHPTKIEFVDLAKLTISKHLLGLFPEAVMRRYQMMPISLTDAELRLAMVDPENQEAIELVRKTVGKPVIPLLTTQHDLARVLDTGEIGGSDLRALAAEAEEVIDAIPEAKVAKETAETAALEHAPAAKLISQLIKRAVRETASDIHLEPFESASQIRLRIDGILRPIASVPHAIHHGLVSRIKILANLRLDEHRLPQDGRFRSVVDGGEIDFRVSIIPTVDGEKIVLRLLDKSAGILTLDQIGLRGQQFAIFEEELHKPHGMILVTGPTGSGKTTTLYGAVDRIRSATTNITTLEDPVEYRLAGINQSQVQTEIGFTFASGLRAILRQDPNVILVGEIRDAETADIAVNAALTGHIVLSTLHTNDAAGAIPRLLDMGVEAFLLTSSINAIVAQRLIRRVCANCKTATPLVGDQKRQVTTELAALRHGRSSSQENTKLPPKFKQLIFYTGKGCAACSQTGYKGRLGIYEILPINDHIKPLIRAQTDAKTLADAARSLGLLTMRQDGLLKALEGITTIEEVWRVTKI